MNTLALLLSTIAIVPQPQKVVEKDGSTTNVAVTSVSDSAIPAEGYRIKVGANGVTVASSDAAGAFYAQETLKQLYVFDDKGAASLPLVEIEDAPQYRWRGVHFDDCRHFFGKETLLGVLDTMAMHKLNVLHWHLTEDQGWRLDVPGYPELVKYGAVRPESIAHGSWDKTNGQPYGPFYYTEKDIREVVSYATERHIKVIPEIELPGHVYAALAAYPEFACRPEHLAKRSPRIQWGIEKDVLCLGNDKAVKFMEDVLAYVCRIFPSDVVHIGGDECPTEMWQACPKCQAKMKAEGLKDAHGLQTWATRHFVGFLAKRGKRVIGWDEYLLGEGIPDSAIGMSWRVGRQGAGHEWLSPADIVARGHDVVLTPTSHCYLDYGQGLLNDPFQYIGGCITLEKAYSLDLCAGIPESGRARVLGGQGNNWSEFTWNEYDLAWKMWPRMSALSEVFWTGEKRPGFADFKRRMETHRGRLVGRHVNCAPVE